MTQFKKWFKRMSLLCLYLIERLKIDKTRGGREDNMQQRIKPRLPHRVPHINYVLFRGSL